VFPGDATGGVPALLMVRADIEQVRVDSAWPKRPIEGTTMAAVLQYVMPIDQVYEPNEVQTATPGRRLGAYALDFVITVFTLYIGWIIWFIFTAQKGQTPGKQLVGLYVIREDGTRAGGWYMWLREWLVKGLLFGLLGAVTGGIVSLLAMLWLLWDRDRQCLWDKVASTHVGYSPYRFMPQTQREQEMTGEVRRRTPGAQTMRPVPDAVGRPQAPPTPGAAPTGEVAGRLRELQRLREEELITEAEYEERRAELVKDL
jgi:uncharacterized RDD family membrane protein YckC